LAKLKVAPKIIEDMLFGYSENPVYVTGIEYDKERDVFVFELDGKDIPKCEEVMAEISVQQNRAQQRFITMKFEKIK